MALYAVRLLMYAYIYALDCVRASLTPVVAVCLFVCLFIRVLCFLQKRVEGRVTHRQQPHFISPTHVIVQVGTVCTRLTVTPGLWGK